MCDEIKKPRKRKESVLDNHKEEITQMLDERKFIKEIYEAILPKLPISITYYGFAKYIQRNKL